MGKKLLLTMTVILVTGAGIAGLVANSKQMKRRKLFKKTGATLYTVGTILRNISCLDCA